MKTMITTEVHVLKVLHQRLGVLGVLSRLVAQFPVHGSLSGNTLLLRFSWLSIPTLYNILWSTCPFVLDRYINLQIHSYASPPFLTYLAAMLVVNTAASAIGWVDVCSLLDQLDKYDSHMHRVPVLTKRITKFEKGFVWIVAPAAQLMFALLKHTGKDTLNNITFLILKPMIHLPILLQCILYFFFCNEIFCRILQLHTSWLKYVQMVCSQNTDKSRLRLDHYRLLYVELLECVNYLNTAFGLKLAAFASLLATDVMISAYFDFTMCHCFLFWNQEMFLCFVLVVSIGYFSRRLHSVSRVMLDKIFDEKICSLNECLRSQMDLLVYQLDRNKVHVMVPGVVHLSKHFSGAFLGGLVTYFILVTQVAVDIEEK